MNTYSRKDWLNQHFALEPRSGRRPEEVLKIGDRVVGARPFRTREQAIEGQPSATVALAAKERRAMARPPRCPAHGLQLARTAEGIAVCWPCHVQRHAVKYYPKREERGWP